MTQTTNKLLSLHAQWLVAQPLPKENHTALMQWIRMRFNHMSNQFEGSTLTYSETQLLLIHGREDPRSRKYNLRIGTQYNGTYTYC